MLNKSKTKIKTMKVKSSSTETVYIVSSNYKTGRNGLPFVYGRLGFYDSIENSEVKVEITFRYAPAKYPEPSLLNAFIDGNKNNDVITEAREEDCKKAIVTALKNIDKKTISLLMNYKEETEEDIIVDNSDIAPIDGLELNNSNKVVETTSDNKDEVIKKLIEENKILKAENKKLKELLNKREEEVVIDSKVEEKDNSLEIIMNNMRKEFDEKINNLRKEMLEKINNNVIAETVNNHVEVKEEKSEVKVMTAEELIAAKELEDMEYQELQKIGKYFKIGAANNSPRVKLIEILRSHINPVVEETAKLKEEVIEEQDNEIAPIIVEDASSKEEEVIEPVEEADEDPFKIEEDDEDELSNYDENFNTTVSSPTDLQKQLLAQISGLI